MSSTATLERKQVAAIVSKPRKNSFKRELGFRALSAVFGAILGLCTPGLDHWYIAWFGLVPLLILIVTARAPYQAAWRGFCMGTAYNLVCMNWYLLVRANVWSGNFSVSPEVMSLGSWILMSIHQGLFFGIFACILKALPLTGGWLPERIGNRWHLPSFVAAPLLWVLITDKIGNAPSVLGVPWTLLEYSQYKQLLIIQSACIIGGIGIGMAILLANCTIAALISFKKAQLCALTCGSGSALLINCCISLLVLAAIPVYGNQRLSNEGGAEKMLTVSAIQSNLARMVNNAGAIEIVSKHLDL